MTRKHSANDTTAATRPRKMIRDSVIMPESEYALIAEIKRRCLAKGLAVKKSEVLRAALIAFGALGDAKLMEAFQKLEVIKTGRPSKSHS